MKANEALIAWTPTFFEDSPTVGQVKVGPLLQEGDPDWTRPYQFTGGASLVDRRSLRGDASTKMLFVDFNTLVVRDGISPRAAHEAFLVIDEYATTISPDIAGARDA